MDVATLLGSYCFPIVACICMAVYVKHVTDASREDMNKLNELHNKEMLAFKDEITKALENNTIALNNLCKEIERRNADGEAK